MKILKITLLLKNDFHSTGESKGSLVDYLRNSNDEPYIPATHIKGIMRTEAERLLRSTENIPCYITGNPNIILCDEVKAGRFRCDVCRVFGVPNTNGGGDYREGKIRITDFITKNKVIAVSRMHVSIIRKTQTKKDHALFNMHSVPSKTEFSGFVLIRERLEDSEDKLLKASIYSMSHYGIGKGRSRGLGGIKCINISEITLDKYLEEII